MFYSLWARWAASLGYHFLPVLATGAAIYLHIFWTCQYHFKLIFALLNSSTRLVTGSFKIPLQYNAAVLKHCSTPSYFLITLLLILSNFFTSLTANSYAVNGHLICGNNSSYRHHSFSSLVKKRPIKIYAAVITDHWYQLDQCFVQFQSAIIEISQRNFSFSEYIIKAFEMKSSLDVKWSHTERKW